MPVYQLSRYNHYVQRPGDDGCFIYNALSNGLAKVSPEEYAIIRRGGQALQELEPETIESLRAGQIVIEDDLDEVKLVRVKLNLARFNSSVLSLTIVPTLGCNMACKYCYEALRSETYMDESTEDAIVAFAKAQIALCGYRGLSVSWFGGEPLLRPKIVYSLSKKLITLCRQKKLGYSAMVVTNGTNLNKTIVQHLKSYKVTVLQVTIDGPKDVHDVRRPFKVGQRSSFDTIVNGVERVLGIVPVIIRINVDKTNYHRSLELVDQLKTRGWLEETKKCGFYVGFTRAWTPACDSIADQCFTMQEYSEIEFAFQKELISRGLKVCNLYPGRSSYCAAASPNGFVVGPGGELFKCWTDVNNPGACIGNVRSPVELKARLLKWLTYDPLEQFPGCRACKYFPICAGGCPDVGIRHGNRDGINCISWKIMMDRKIDVFLGQLDKQHAKRDDEQCEQPFEALATR